MSNMKNIVETAIETLPTDYYYLCRLNERSPEIRELRKLTEDFTAEDFEALNDALWDAKEELEEDIDTAHRLYQTCQERYTKEEAYRASLLEDTLRNRMRRLRYFKDLVEGEIQGFEAWAMKEIQRCRA